MRASTTSRKGSDLPNDLDAYMHPCIHAYMHTCIHALDRSRSGFTCRNSGGPGFVVYPWRTVEPSGRPPQDFVTSWGGTGDQVSLAGVTRENWTMWSLS